MVPHMADHPQRPRERPIDSWYRELNDGRVEIMCKAPGYHLRVSALPDEAWAYVATFEEQTGLRVNSDRRPRIIGAPMIGQMTMEDVDMADGLPPTEQLESARG